MVLEEAVDGGLGEFAGRGLLGAYEQLDDPLDRAARPLPLGADDEPGEVGADIGGAEIRAVLGPECGEAAVPVGVVPALDGARGQVPERAVGPLPAPLGRLAAESDQVAMLKLGADQRPEDRDAEEGDVLLGLVIHGRVVPRGRGQQRWGHPRGCPSRAGTGSVPRTYVRRIPGISRWSNSASEAKALMAPKAAEYLSTILPRSA